MRSIFKKQIKKQQLSIIEEKKMRSRSMLHFVKLLNKIRFKQPIEPGDSTYNCLASARVSSLFVWINNKS